VKYNEMVDHCISIRRIYFKDKLKLTQSFGEEALSKLRLMKKSKEEIQELIFKYEEFVLNEI
jgi:hypothetical protein